jgi:hypothetical protein
VNIRGSGVDPEGGKNVLLQYKNASFSVFPEVPVLISAPWAPADIILPLMDISTGFSLHMYLPLFERKSG